MHTILHFIVIILSLMLGFVLYLDGLSLQCGFIPLLISYIGTLIGDSLGDGFYSLRSKMKLPVVHSFGSIAILFVSIFLQQVLMLMKMLFGMPVVAACAFSHSYLALRKCQDVRLENKLVLIFCCFFGCLGAIIFPSLPWNPWKGLFFSVFYLFISFAISISSAVLASIVPSLHPSLPHPTQFAFLSILAIIPFFIFSQPSNSVASHPILFYSSCVLLLIASFVRGICLAGKSDSVANSSAPSARIIFFFQINPLISWILALLLFNIFFYFNLMPTPRAFALKTSSTQVHPEQNNKSLALDQIWNPFPSFKYVQDVNVQVQGFHDVGMKRMDTSSIDEFAINQDLTIDAFFDDDDFISEPIQQFYPEKNNDFPSHKRINYSEQLSDIWFLRLVISIGLFACGIFLFVRKVIAVSDEGSPSFLKAVRRAEEGLRVTRAFFDFAIYRESTVHDLALGRLYAEDATAEEEDDSGMDGERHVILMETGKPLHSISSGDSMRDALLSPLHVDPAFASIGREKTKELEKRKRLKRSRRARSSFKFSPLASTLSSIGMTSFDAVPPPERSAVDVERQRTAGDLFAFFIALHPFISCRSEVLLRELLALHEAEARSCLQFLLRLQRWFATMHHAQTAESYFNFKICPPHSRSKISSSTLTSAPSPVPTFAIDHARLATHVTYKHVRLLKSMCLRLKRETSRSVSDMWQSAGVLSKDCVVDLVRNILATDGDDGPSAEFADEPDFAVVQARKEVIGSMGSMYREVESTNPNLHEISEPLEKNHPVENEVEVEVTFEHATQPSVKIDTVSKDEALLLAAADGASVDDLRTLRELLPSPLWKGCIIDLVRDLDILRAAACGEIPWGNPELWRHRMELLGGVLSFLSEKAAGNGEGAKMVLSISGFVFAGF